MSLDLRTPTVVIGSPLSGAIVGFAPFEVLGQITAEGYPEPVSINSVTVQVDSGPVIAATLKQIPNRTLTEVSFQATAQVTGGEDPHLVTVVVASDGGTVSKAVSVSAGLRAVAPAVVIDFAALPVISFSQLDLQSLVSILQKGLQAISQTLTSINQIGIGPNILATSDAGFPILRFGFWIEPFDFPAIELVPPSEPDFPLPQLTVEAAAAAFGITPILNLPSLSGIGSYAFSVPLTTIQLLLDAVKPLVIQQIGSAATLNSVTAALHAPAPSDAAGGDLTITFGGVKDDISFEASLKEVVGLATASAADGSENVPAVLSTDTSTSVGSVLQWLLAYLIPFADLALLIAWGELSFVTSSAGGKAAGVLSSLLKSLRPRIPFSDTILTSLLSSQSGLHFPAVDFNWHSFGVTDSSLTGSGIVEIVDRDPSMATIEISGPTKIDSYAPGTDVEYQLVLANLYPDKGGLNWQIAGTALSGPIVSGFLAQTASFTVEFPLTAQSKYGQFVVIVNAVETGGTDPSLKITASSSLTVAVTLAKNPP